MNVKKTKSTMLALKSQTLRIGEKVLAIRIWMKLFCTRLEKKNKMKEHKLLIGTIRLFCTL